VVRLLHRCELLVVGIAEGAAGAGGTGRLRGGVRVWAGELGRQCGGRPTDEASILAAAVLGFPRKIREIYARGGIIIPLFVAVAVARQARRRSIRR
jgi:hypothetical protein